MVITFPSSEEQIAEIYFQYLASIPASKVELLPTRENAEAFTAHVLGPAWRRREPILFVISKTRIVGATFTTLPNPLFQYKTPFATGHGTWVAPDFRGKGICRMLIEEVRRMLKVAGVNCQMGMAHLENTLSVEAFKRLGFVEHGIILRADI